MCDMCHIYMWLCLWVSGHPIFSRVLIGWSTSGSGSGIPIIQLGVLSLTVLCHTQKEKKYEKQKWKMKNEKRKTNMETKNEKPK